MHFGIRFRALALATVGLCLAAACGSSGTTTTTSILTSYKPVPGVKGGQLVYSDWEPVQDLNVLSSTAATTQEVATGPLWASLWVVRPTEQRHPRPRLRGPDR